MTWRIEVGDCRDALRSMPVGSVHTVVTSPPYFGLRDYGNAGQIGLEPTPGEFVAALVAVFREVRRVLRDDGTVWLNLGDSYNNRAVNRPSSHQGGLGFESEHLSTAWRDHAASGRARMSIQDGDLKEKDLIGVPWMVAFALRADGWYLRSDIIWSKPNPMPESVTDRPTKSHEYVFLLSKGPRYFYDGDAVREDLADANAQRTTEHYDTAERYGAGNGGNGGLDSLAARMRSGDHAGRNKRSVWTVATQPYAGAHFATFPPKLIEPCILAGAPERACGECGAPWVRVVERTANERTAPLTTQEVLGEHFRARGMTGNGGNIGMPKQTTAMSHTLGFESSCACVVCPVHGILPAGLQTCDRCDAAPVDAPTVPGVVLDPFAGAGTTGLVALQHGREFVGIELSPDYAAMARGRIETAVRLGFRAPQNGREQIPGQLDIFGVA